MCMSFKIQRVFYGLQESCVFPRLQSGLFCAVIFLIIAAPHSNAVAQFPGVGSEAPSGVAIEAGYDGSLDVVNADTSISDAGVSDSVGSASNGARDVAGQLNGDGGRSGDSTPTQKKEHHRNRLFVKKLRSEFAAIELVERKTGLPFSRDNVPRYLDELRSDLKAMVAGAENGRIVAEALKSIARDAYVIETRIHEHLDQLLELAGQPVQGKSFFAIMPALPKASLKSAAEIDVLSLKFELAEYGEKALQAMGAKRF
jgi:hypothetical protein